MPEFRLLRRRDECEVVAARNTGEHFSSDWGNPIQRWFIDTAVPWHARLVVTPAQGFFKVAIRKNRDVPVWSCALEWNEGLRVVAFFGEREPALALGRDMPRLFSEEHVIQRSAAMITSMRPEVPISPDEDKMFSFDG